MAMRESIRRWWWSTGGSVWLFVCLFVGGKCCSLREGCRGVGEGRGRAREREGRARVRGQGMGTGSSALVIGEWMRRGVRTGWIEKGIGRNMRGKRIGGKE